MRDHIRAQENWGKCQTLRRRLSVVLLYDRHDRIFSRFTLNRNKSCPLKLSECTTFCIAVNIHLLKKSVAETNFVLLLKLALMPDCDSNLKSFAWKASSFCKP